MQLSSRILTALAVLILAVAVVAVRGGSSGTVEAATGTIDVLNVGTCYTTNSDVFGAGDCNDGAGDYEVTGRDSVNQVGTVYATYSHDPKTAADNPRGVLTNSDLIMVSIEDTGRDKRTPVVLPVGAASTTLSASDYKVIDDDFGIAETKDREGEDNTVVSDDEGVGLNRVGLTAKNVIEFTDTDAASDAVTYHLATDMYWGTDATYATGTSRGAGDFNPGVKNGLTVLIDADGVDDIADNEDDVAYLPMHVADNAVVRFYGCIDGDGDDACGDDEDFADLTNNGFRLDEDRGSGRTDGEVTGAGAVAPWLNVQVLNANAVLQYIVYHTSEQETLVGGHSDATSGSTVYPSGVNQPDFTKSERDGDRALVVTVKSDGDATIQNLWLYETGRFTGRYEGYARLTDADGDGSDQNEDSPTPATPIVNNWGLEVKDASGRGIGGAAVIGVESGPVTIEYRDTDGHVQSKTITIDTVPPAVQIDTPAHKSRDQDTSPEFAGSFNDGESGLRQNSFQLYIDNSDDRDENGEDGALALALPVDGSQGYGNVDDPGNDPVRSIEDYAGFGEAAPQFGVIEHTKLYGTDTSTSGLNEGLAYENDELLNVRGDRFSDGARSGTFADSVRIRIDGDDGSEVDPYNNTIDFHALVADVAGNIGFSDSDDAGPRLINDYGKKSDDRKTGRYNVLGWYARHVFHLDEKDPDVYREQSVTGFYGINDDDAPVVNRSGILVVFDAAVDPDTVGVGTFEVTLDSDASATVSDVTVEGRQVYLLLSEELASDATPSVQIAAGQSISDPAGNRLTRGGLGDAIELNDGIAPQFTVLLRGGSGTGEGNEASNKLTNEAMTITIVSDEEINSTPSITVVCSNIKWTEGTGDDAEEKDLSNFTGARSGPGGQSTAVFPQPNFACGDGAEEIVAQQVQAFSRPGLEWEYQWQNFSDDKELPDGKLTVVAYGRDRQSYASLKGRAGDETVANTDDTFSWGAATAEFNYDATNPELNDTSEPDDGDTVTDVRPFLLLNFDDKSTVSVSKLTIDGTDQTEQVQTLGAKRFLYWPETLAIGSHDVAVEAVDAAGNKSGSIEYSFKVAERATFNVKLIAGWNAVSLPANPIDPDVGSVFTEPIVDMIAAWDGENPEAPWSIATRMEGEWSTHSDFATLGRITARYGYWVHAQGFVTQSVALVGKGNREDPTTVPADLVEIPTNPGWNFVGVVDQDGDQTQDDYGEALMNGTTEINAKGYLGDHVRAYTWDAIRNRFDILEEGDTVTIGEGIWVYYGGGIAP